MSSGKIKQNLRKTRARLHQANHILKLQRERLQSENDRVVDYVGGVAKLGQFVLDGLAAHEADRAGLLYMKITTLAIELGLIVRNGDKWELTQVCKPGAVNAQAEEAAPETPA